jgi:oxygen-independent coproporphyrinogen-3 oxidase
MTLHSAVTGESCPAASAYATYPAANWFVEAFDASTLRQWIIAGNALGVRHGTTLEVHFPVSRGTVFEATAREPASGSHRWYQHYLEREIRLVGALVPSDTAINGMHWSGWAGLLPQASLARLMEVICESLPFAEAGEFSADVNSLVSTPRSLALLREIGVTRVEIGTPELASLLPNAVRWQERQQLTSALATTARAEGMESIGVDLIHGCPGQTTHGFTQAMDELLLTRPDRVNLRAGGGSSTLSRQDMLALAVQGLVDAGYTCIGIGQFARSSDPLAIAHRRGCLTRLPYGYSPRACGTLIAIGPGAIGMAGPTYYQNHRVPEDYCNALDSGELPVMRGRLLTPDDLVRRAVIHSFSTNLFVDIEVIEIAYLLDFRSYFALEMDELAQFEDEGLLRTDDGLISVTPAGWLALSTICAVFDSYARSQRQRIPSSNPL